jgi:hypothetical protein
MVHSCEFPGYVEKRADHRSGLLNDSYPVACDETCLVLLDEHADGQRQRAATEGVGRSLEEGVPWVDGRGVLMVRSMPMLPTPLSLHHLPMGVSSLREAFGRGAQRTSRRRRPESLSRHRLTRPANLMHNDRLRRRGVSNVRRRQSTLATSGVTRKQRCLPPRNFSPTGVLLKAAGPASSRQGVLTGPILTALGCCRLREQVGDNP